jgi:hypothetical protein
MAAGLVFLSPLGALLALGALVPLASLFLVSRRARRVRRRLGLREPSLRHLVVALAALSVAGAFLGTAAAQPVLERERTLRTRTDAEAFVVLDISRSMLAQSGSGSPKRIDRAKAAAIALRRSLPEVRVGVASLTDRMLPHLFPSTDAEVFDATVDRSLGIEQPPPRSSLVARATNLDALTAVRSQRYFAPASRERLLIVLTDGETQPVSGARLKAVLRRDPAVDTIFVQFWESGERVYTRGVPEPQYRPDPSARSLLDGLAATIEGTVYDEGDLAAARQKSRELLGNGPTITRGQVEGRVPLAPYLVAATVLPVALLLWRRDR